MKPLDADFWNAFGTDWRGNCLAWQRGTGSSLPPSGQGWQQRWTANPTFHLRDEDNTLLLYYRGNGELPSRPGEWHDRIGVAQVQSLSRDGLTLKALADGPIVDVGPPGSFSASDVLDPAIVSWNGHVFLYYSAIGAGPDSIGLARSVDGLRGERFEAVGSLGAGRAPSALAWNGHVYLLVQDWLPDDTAKQRYGFFLWRSEDGEHFAPVQDDPIFTPTAGDWDGLSVVTGRLHGGADGWAYLLYGGSAGKTDEPEHFGLARSRDLVTWERHPGNPVFGAGARGAADGGAIWFPALCALPGGWALLYEGSSGTYDWNLQSEICFAWLSAGFVSTRSQEP